MEPNELQLHRITSTLLTQFPGLDIAEVTDNIRIKISRKTNRIRSISVTSEGEEIRLFSLRTSDGRFIPTFAGARRIIETGYMKNRVVMNHDAAPFIAAGKSAFCKHVISVTDNIYPNSEVFVFDPDGNFLAVGTSMQPAYAIEQLESGVAVKIKHYRDS